jgi:hypothetical protein
LLLPLNGRQLETMTDRWLLSAKSSDVVVSAMKRVQNQTEQVSLVHAQPASNSRQSCWFYIPFLPASSHTHTIGCTFWPRLVRLRLMMALEKYFKSFRSTRIFKNDFWVYIRLL